MGRAEVVGQVVSVLAFYSDDLISNPSLLKRTTVNI